MGGVVLAFAFRGRIGRLPEGGLPRSLCQFQLCCELRKPGADFGDFPFEPGNVMDRLFLPLRQAKARLPRFL